MFGKKLTDKQTSRINDEFESFNQKDYSEEDMNKIFENEKSILDKINSDENLRKFIDETKLFVSMLKDFFTHVYTEVPIGTIMAIVGSLLYVICPLDLIPDFIPIIGYLDDAAILAGCIKAVEVDIKKYKEFKEI